MMEQLSLFDLNIKIKDCLKSNLEESYWVVAEIGEIRVNQKGHCYLELVEKSDDQIIAQNRAIIWSYTYRNLSGWFEAQTGQALKPGLKILSNASVSYHEIYGLSLNIRDIDATYTIGERAKKRLEIINKLKDDGVYDLNRQIPLPLVPQRIAVIASSTSAGYLDFMNQLENNTFNYRFRVSHYQAIMQGHEAEASIIGAMLEIHKDIELFDILVIIRGGGATLDLECFDGYDLASHVSQFPIPVVTGIGHERDETITDMVSNTALKTPTAVAEFLISGCRQFEEHINNLCLQVIDKVQSSFKDNRNHLENLCGHLKYITENTFKGHKLRLNVLGQNIVNAAMGRKRLMETALSGYVNSIRLHTGRFLALQKKDLFNLAKGIEWVDPKSVLRRGYSITRSKGKIIKSANVLQKGDIIENQFYDGEKESKIL
jgi:exodeoxyribonuclease VII large subunit